MLIGNGFTIDFGSRYGLNPSAPLSHFGKRNLSYEKYIHKLPYIQNELFQLAQYEPNEYEAIERFMNSRNYNWDKDCQLRRFLSLSYASFQIYADSKNIVNWKWTKWLQQNYKDLIFVVSFNYDLVFEKALETSNIHFFRTGSLENQTGIPIFKPHGSIDFETNTSEYSVEDRWQMTTLLQDNGKVTTVPKEDWLEPRLEADIIPPHKDNYQRILSWVKNGIDQFNTRGKDINLLIIVGHSYGEADRQEVDQYLVSLKPDTKIIIVDPKPNPDLLKKIDELNLKRLPTNAAGLPW
ncbi:hypothetical protein CR203_14975 [Salipaludibacillus neizhouensis]|uniref:SIR2-like domain-containing protein n=1 Tax=Salipaludibacillus neizhouensis TaxID=885475 RepID=A0A3A9K1I3_9BACI|nr:hypothetical protein [Salipaludibacillus neizhouensis]RKL66587.1 hypothetical protein CR203_14975 [Salipaludibacillus neizhouensis]